MKKAIIIIIGLYFFNSLNAQTLQSVTTSGNSTTNAVRLTGETNIGASGGGELVLGLLNSNKTSDTRTFVGWKNTGNTITDGLAGTLLLQGRSDIVAPIDFATGIGTPLLRMRIGGDGKVGIGTNIPLEKVHIQNGNLIITSTSNALNTEMGALKFAQSSYSNAYAGIAGKTNGGGIDQLDLVFYTSYGAASEKMRIMSNTGFVGIGNTTPLAKLDVNGNIFTNSKILIGTTDLAKAGTYSLAVNGDALINKVRIKQYANWPDFVFEEKYGLLPLEEVEKFITANKHLPAVPTAAEVEKDGIDLGSTQTVLLQKIEELTLYAIEQNKKTIAQQEQINMLLKDLEALKAQQLK